MPYNGSGGFTSIGAPYFPAVPNTTILADQFNLVLNDVFAGLGQVVTRDGQSPATANLPMGGNKHTGVASATGSGEYLVYGQNSGLIGNSWTFNGANYTWSGDPTHSGNHTFSGAVTVGGTLTASGALAASGALTVAGVTTLNGNMVFGDAGTDTLTIAPSAVTWSNNPTHSGTHTFSGLVNASLGVRAQSGAVAPFTPNAGYAFSGDTDSGMFSPADGVVQFGVNGTEVGRLTETSAVWGVTTQIQNSAPSLQWRETDQALPAGLWRAVLDGNNLFLQRNTAGDGSFSSATSNMTWSASGAVGIGTANPRTDLEIASAGEVTTAFFSNDGPADAKIWRAGVEGSSRSFIIDTVNDAYSGSRLAYAIDRSGFEVSAHRWVTSNIERMRLDSSGRLMLGATSTDRRFDVVAPNGYAATIVRSQSVNRTSTDWSQSQFEAYTQPGSTIDFASVAFHVQDASNAPQIGYRGDTQRIGIFSSAGSPLCTVDDGGRDFNPSGRIRSAATAPAYASSLTIDALVQDLVLVGTLTGDVTSMTINNPAQGQFLSIRFKQDATGGRTVAVPSGAKVSGSVGTAANQVSYLNITYNSTDARWEGSWLVVPV